MKIPKGMEVGTVYQSKSCGKYKIKTYLGYTKVEVEFIETGYTFWSKDNTVRIGEIKDRLSATVFGVGFIGVGKYTATTRGRRNKSYQSWVAMLARCYDPKTQARAKTYTGCSVDPIWHNFQNFAKWFYDNYPKANGDWALDKDILVEGNKIYSPNFCLFVSKSENTTHSNKVSRNVVSPEGELVLVDNIKLFCKERGIPLTGFRLMLKGEKDTYKGWSLP